MRSLCMGRVEEALLFPFPKMKKEEQETLRTLAQSFQQWLGHREKEFRKWVDDNMWFFSKAGIKNSYDKKLSFGRMILADGDEDWTKIDPKYNAWEFAKLMFGSSGSKEDNMLMVNAIKQGWAPGDIVPTKFQTKKYKDEILQSNTKEISNFDQFYSDMRKEAGV